LSEDDTDGSQLVKTSALVVYQCRTLHPSSLNGTKSEVQVRYTFSDRAVTVPSMNGGGE
jgi:hypothetical protein